MAGNSNGSDGITNNGPASHFGKQIRKARRERGMSLPELARQTGINVGHLSRIENGHRPPTERIASACDAVFPERKGWFLEYYSELQGWSEVPAGFRDWSEIEEKATTLRDWQPSIVTGLLQVEDYARTLIEAFPGTSAQVAAMRLAARMERQRRVLNRDDPPRVVFVVDEPALYRCVGSAEIMAAQLWRLLAVAELPNVTVQVMPAVAHCANASGMIIAGESAAYAEHQVGGYAFTDEQTVSALALQFDTLRGECYRVSETAALLGRTYETWARGGNPATATATAASA